MGITIFILLLGGLILIHEWGHFFSARLLGVGVEEFSIGFPPRILSRQGPKTRWTVGLVPLGGYVRIRGEDQGASRTSDRSSFASRGPFSRATIIASGVVVNFLAGVVILSLGGLVGMPTIVSSTLPPGARTANHRWYLSEIEIDSPAEKAGLLPGDLVVSLANTSLTDLATLRRLLVGRSGQDVAIIIRRKGEDKTLTVIPEPGPDGARIGVILAEVADVRYRLPMALRQGVVQSVDLVQETVSFFATTFKRIVKGGGVPTELRGPVGIASMAGEVVAGGLRAIIPFAALITVNLAVLNSLPIPALDGGRLLFIILEIIRRRPLERRYERWAHTLGFVFLISLILVVTYRDIVRALV